jgi:hypothetical protein
MKKLQYLLMACLLLSIACFAQKEEDEKTSKAEIKKQEEQKKKRDEIFNSPDPDFKVLKVPEKWNNESAVVLCQKYFFNYQFEPFGIMLRELVRRRIMLLDKAAVEVFSEFYYNNSDLTGFRVIKPGGKTVTVDQKNAVKVSSEVTIPRIFRSVSYGVSYMKIAIPDLEPGDIIDYFYKSDNQIAYAYVPTYYSYSPVIATLASSYPIVKQKYEFIVAPHFFIDCKSFNGAAQLVEKEPEDISKDKVSRKARAYVIEDKDREKTEDEMWSIELINEPMIKFQAYYVASRKENQTYEFLGETTEPRTQIVTGEEIRTLVKRYLDNNVSSTDVGAARSWINKNCKSKTDPKQVALTAFYYFRTAYNYYAYNYSTAEYDEYTGPGEWEFMNFMTSLMKAMDMENATEVVAVVPRNLGNLKTLVLRYEISFGVRIGGSNGIILFPFTRYKTHESMDPDYMGMEAYCFSIDKKESKKAVQTFIMPGTKADDNLIKADYDVKLTDDMEFLQVKRNTAVSGMMRSYAKSRAALFTLNFRKTDAQKYDIKYDDGTEQRNQKKANEAVRKKEESEAERVKNQKEYWKKDLEDDFEVEAYDNFKLVNPGRELDNPVLAYEEQFKLKGMLNKAGRNYSLDVGKLVGGQLKLEEKDMKRKSDIYYSFPRKLVNNITIEIPSGYVPENLKDLDVMVDNEAGSFTSTAKFEGGKIVVTTTKIYKTNFMKNDKWPLWIDFLETAYNYSQKKVILKKG